jgi:hypothetical protein
MAQIPAQGRNDSNLFDIFLIIMIGAYQILLLFSFLAFSRAAQRDLRYGVYAVIFLMPAYLWRFSLRGIPATALEILIYLLFGTWLARSGKVRETLRDIARDKVLAFGIALLLAGVVLSTLNSTDMRTSLGVFKGWFVDPLLFFLMYISVIRTPDEVRATLRAYTASACAVALVAAIYALSGHFTFDGRLRAFYESPTTWPCIWRRLFLSRPTAYAGTVGNLIRCHRNP